MLLKRVVSFFSTLIVLAVVLAPGAGRSQDSSEGAKTFVAGLADQAINALTFPDISKEERSKRFRVLLKDNFDVNTIARWVLGRYWNKANEAEQKEYLTLFEDLLVVTYVDRFANYAGESLNVTKSVAINEKDTVVYSEIVRTKGEAPVHVDWRLRTNELKFKIIDVMVEGVSMGQTQRSEFASVIRQNGGKLESLLVELRKRVSNDA